jgi:hypothetical protein
VALPNHRKKDGKRPFTRVKSVSPCHAGRRQHGRSHRGLAKARVRLAGGRSGAARRESRLGGAGPVGVSRRWDQRANSARGP